MKATFALFAMFLGASPVLAQENFNVADRLIILRQTDPELFGFIQAITARATARSQVEGGFSLEVRDATLSCDKTPEERFDSCTVAIDLQGQSFASSPDYRSSQMEVECQADLETRPASGFSDRQPKTESTSLSFYGGGTDSDTLTLRFNTYAPHDPVVHAEIKAVDCEITDIR